MKSGNTVQEGTEDSHGGLARAALFIAVGNIASRLLGLVRETVIANLFGATGLVSAFRVAQIIPTMLYDLLVGGMISSALVPIFSEQADHKNKDTLWHVVSLVLSLTVVVMAIVVLLIELVMPQAAYLMAGGFDDELLVATTRLMRITTPAVFFLSLSGVITGLLYALKRFALPAFTAAIFNATIVVAALVGVSVFGWGIEVLAMGLLLGAVLQVLLQLPALYGVRLRFVIDLQHPVLRRIGKLYLPIILGLAISQIAIALDRNFASRTGEQTIAWMQFATTIIQFPLGLISAAISLAILPTLSRIASEAGQKATDKQFMDTLAAGLRMVLILIIPATVALFVLAKPVVALIFEHGDFTPFDTAQTTTALRIYLLGLTFAAIDQPLIFAFYARQNTITPALVGLAGVGFYLLAALPPTLFRPMQMTDLVLANSVQLTAHALIMLWLVNRVASLQGRGLFTVTIKAVAASAVMGLGLWLLMPVFTLWLPETGFLYEAAFVGLLTVSGAAIYFLSLILLRTEELALLLKQVKKTG